MVLGVTVRQVHVACVHPQAASRDYYTAPAADSVVAAASRTLV